MKQSMKFYLHCPGRRSNRKTGLSMRLWKGRHRDQLVCHFKFNEGSREYLVERAKNGVGLIILGITCVKSLMGNKVAVSE